MSWQAVIIAIACWVGIILILASLDNTKAWERFKNEHHCKIVAKKDGQWIWSMNGHDHYVPGTETWRCDDGVDYTK